MEKLIVAVLWFLSVLASGLIGFLVSYLKKKGENLATHEDIKILVDQVRAVTTATKEIEAKISSDVWDRQKRWEMKREVLFEITRRLGAMQDSLIGLNSAHATERRLQQNGGAVSLEPKLLASEKWMDESRKFEETGLLVGIVCRKEVVDACDTIRVFTRQIAFGIFKNDPEVYTKSAAELARKSFAVTNAIRKELETDKTA
jgi:hypothetical protein